MFKKVMIGILVYTLVIVVIVKRGVLIDFLPLRITASGVNQLGVFVGTGAVLWFVYEILRPIIKALTLPINWITLGIAHLVLNILLLYAFPMVVALFPRDVQVVMGSFIEVMLLALLLRIVGRLF